MMIAEYLDALLIKGGKEFAAFLLYPLILGGPTWLICTRIARCSSLNNGVRLFVLLPCHLMIPYFLHDIVIDGIYHEFEEYGQEFDKARYLNDSFEIFLTYVLFLFIPLYLLKLWKFKDFRPDQAPTEQP